MELLTHNKKLGNIEKFPSQYVEALAELGIFTVKDLETAEVNTIARCIYDYQQTAAGDANDPIMIGGEMAVSLQAKYRCSSPIKTALDARKDRYVYRAATARTIILKRTTTALVNDGSGGYNREVAAPPIAIVFNGGRNSYGILIVNETLARNHEMDVDQLRAMVERHSQFGSEFFLVSKPEEDSVIQGSKGEANKINTGVRATSDA